MRLLLLIFGIALFFSPYVSRAEEACGAPEGWANSDSAGTTKNLGKVISELESRHKVDIVALQGEVDSCGYTGVNFLITEKGKKKILGRVPVPQDISSGFDNARITDPGFLEARVNQLMQTPKKQLLQIEQAQKDFDADNSALKKEFGVNAYVPNAIPLKKRVVDDKKEKLVATAPKCTEAYRTNSENFSASLLTSVFEYIPGRQDYANDSIYRKGDLRKEFLANSALKAEALERAKNNANSPDACKGPGHVDWLAISKKLAEKAAAKPAPEPAEKTEGESDAR